MSITPTVRRADHLVDRRSGTRLNVALLRRGAELQVPARFAGNRCRRAHHCPMHRRILVLPLEPNWGRRVEDTVLPWRFLPRVSKPELCRVLPVPWGTWMGEGHLSFATVAEGPMGSCGHSRKWLSWDEFAQTLCAAVTRYFAGGKRIARLICGLSKSASGRQLPFRLPADLDESTASGGRTGMVAFVGTENT